jgi:hypothetical protein
MSSTVSIYPTSGGAGITLIQEQNIFPTSIAAFGSNVFVANQLNVSEYNFSGGLINASFGGGAGGPIETIATSESGLFELNISSNQTLREYDAITGATINASLITGLNTGYIAVEGTAVPEPSTYAAIMGFASVGFVMVRRRFVRK